MKLALLCYLMNSLLAQFITNNYTVDVFSQCSNLEFDVDFMLHDIQIYKPRKVQNVTLQDSTELAEILTIQINGQGGN